MRTAFLGLLSSILLHFTSSFHHSFRVSSNVYRQPRYAYTYSNRRNSTFMYESVFVLALLHSRERRTKVSIEGLSEKRASFSWRCYTSSLPTEEIGEVQPWNKVEIEYCYRCRWLLRSSWLATELLTTFEVRRVIKKITISYILRQ